MGKEKAIALIALLALSQPAWADLSRQATLATGLHGSAVVDRVHSTVDSFLFVTVAPSPNGQFSGTVSAAELDPVGQSDARPAVRSGGQRFAAGAGLSRLRSAAECPATHVLEIPPPPDSGVLTFSGLITVAGLQLARSTRAPRLGSLSHLDLSSDWCRIGSTQFQQHAPRYLPRSFGSLCCSGAIAATTASALISSEATESTRIDPSQRFPFSLIPRSPPVCV